MQQIIRIEHTDGIGMFRLCDLNYDYRPHSIYNLRDIETWAEELSQQHERFEILPIDIPDSSDEHFCAYKTIEQLQEWCTNEQIRQLIKAGYSVYLIEVSDCLEGKYQIAYKISDIISKTNMNSLFE